MEPMKSYCLEFGEKLSKDVKIPIVLMNEDCITKAAQHIARVGYHQDNKKIKD